MNHDVKKKKKKQQIHVVVVESHQHVLEHIHAVLRRERLLAAPWSMLHLDAHPDLACPQARIPAKACFLPRESFAAVVVPTRTTTTSTTTTTALSNANEANKSNDDDNQQLHSNVKKNLYEFLDSTATGIAEWILPLVLAANLRQVHWIQPNRGDAAIIATTKTTRGDGSSNPIHSVRALPCPPCQLPCGVHHYQVGVSVPLLQDSSGGIANKDSSPSFESFMDLPTTATVKVDWPHPYYLEDDSTVHFGNDHNEKDGIANNNRELFLFPQPLQLQVSTLPICVEKTIGGGRETGLRLHNHNDPLGRRRPLWLLDICLDYFVCDNPFLADLEKEDRAYTVALMTVVFRSRFFDASIMATPSDVVSRAEAAELNPLQHYRRDLQAFWKDLMCLLRELLPHQEQSSSQPSTRDNNTNEDAYTPNIASYYMDPIEGQSCWNKLAKAFLESPCQDDQTGEQALTLLAMTEQALPNLMMPHGRQMTGGKNDDENTPSPAISKDRMQSALQQVLGEIERHTSQAESEPFMITMARSSIDGFTPTQVVEELQQGLLERLHDIYCGCSELKIPCETTTESGAAVATEKASERGTCKFTVLFDYGPWEGTAFE